MSQYGVLTGLRIQRSDGLSAPFIGTDLCASVRPIRYPCFMNTYGSGTAACTTLEDQEVSGTRIAARRERRAVIGGVAAERFISRTFLVCLILPPPLR